MSQTRMHSSRMRTARSSSHQAPPNRTRHPHGADTPWDQAPPPPVNRILDTRLLKYYLAPNFVTTIAIFSVTTVVIACNLFFSVHFFSLISFCAINSFTTFAKRKGKFTVLQISGKTSGFDDLFSETYHLHFLLANFISP